MAAILQEPQQDVPVAAEPDMLVIEVLFVLLITDFYRRNVRLTAPPILMSERFASFYNVFVIAIL
jgi:hypothetical protein